MLLLVVNCWCVTPVLPTHHNSHCSTSAPTAAADCLHVSKTRTHHCSMTDMRQAAVLSSAGQ